MRRRGRECALQVLYQLDIARELDGAQRAALAEDALKAFWASFETVGEDDRAFAERLVRGVVGELVELDQAITKASEHWRMTRMDKVDKSLLRLAAYEILRCPDIPRAASINEAIEIAKRFSGKESASFINGILDQLKSGEGKTDVDLDPA
jgi:N utilization substance protein B